MAHASRQGDGLTSMSDAETAFDYLTGPYGVVALLLLFIWAAFLKEKPIIVAGWVYRAMEADRNLWREAATKSTHLATTGADLAREAVDAVKRSL